MLAMSLAAAALEFSRQVPARALVPAVPVFDQASSQAVVATSLNVSAREQIAATGPRACEVSIAWTKIRSSIWNERQEECGKAYFGFWKNNAAKLDKCLEDRLYFKDDTAQCKGCFADLLSCSVRKCWAKCICKGACCAKCLECGESKCNGDFIRCSGIVDMPDRDCPRV